VKKAEKAEKSMCIFAYQVKKVEKIVRFKILGIWHLHFFAAIKNEL